VILLPPLERDVVVLHPLDEAIGAGADRKQLRVLLADRLLVHDLGGLRQRGQERPPRAAQVEARLILADRLHALERGEEDAHRQLVLGVEDAREGERDVLGRERLAVVKRGVVDEVEEPGLVVFLLPRLRQAGTNWPASST
jgi:hypothetical protein